MIRTYGGGRINHGASQAGSSPAFVAIPATFYETFFPSTENPISESGKWLNGATDGLDWIDLQTSPGKLFANAFDPAPGGVMDGLAQLSRTFLACTSNQYAEGTIFSTYSGGGPPSGSHEAEVHCNMTITAHSVTGYECYLNWAGNHTLVRWNGVFGDFTPLASNNISTFTAPVAGDVIRIENNSGVLSCYQNGVLRTQATDTTFTNGNPGMGNNAVSPATLNAYGFSRWKGGNL